MIIATQLKVTRALLEMDQRALAAVAGLSLPTIQRMEASAGTIRGECRFPGQDRPPRS